MEQRQATKAANPRTPQSAFAARKAKINPFTDVTNRSHDSQKASLTHLLIKDTSTLHPPYKKQRLAYDQTGPLRQSEARDSDSSVAAPNLTTGSSVHRNKHEMTSVPTIAKDKLDQDASFSLQFNRGTRQRSESVETSMDSEYGTEVEGEYSDSNPKTEFAFHGQGPDQTLSTFQPNVHNVISENDIEWSIRLQVGDTLCMVGQYDIWVRKGAISIMGAVLHPSSKLHRVFAPSTHSLPSIRPILDPYRPSPQYTELTIISCTSRIRVLRHLSPKFGRIWNKCDAPDVQTGNSIDLTKRSFIFLKNSAEDKHKRPLRILQPFSDRQILIDRLLSRKSWRPKSILICGPKDSGKSTLCRMLVNAMLTRPQTNTLADGTASTRCVAFLDIDPGQPEFSPPGELSLVLLRSHILGPPYTHPKILGGSGNIVLRAHHLGSISPKDDPGFYVRCALDLLNHYRRLLAQYPACPLVLNSAGWVQGVGLEVLSEVIKSSNMSDIVYTSTHGPQEVVNTLVEVARPSGASMHFLASQESRFATRTASDLRQMQTMAYFHLDSPEADNFRWDALPLLERVPLSVHWAGEKQALFAIVHLIDHVDPDHLGASLDQCIVGLVVIEDETAASGHVRTKTDHNTAAMLETEEAIASPENAFTVMRSDSSTDTESESDNVAGLNSSMQSRRNQSPNTGAPLGMNTSYNDHPFILRNSMDMPYIPSGTSTAALLNPASSYSLGQAFVRGIDLEAKCLLLVTPVPLQVFQILREQRRKILLVGSRLETPAWASQEEWERGAALRQKLRKENPEDMEVTEAEERRQWAHRTPYLSSCNQAAARSASARVWTKHQGSDTQLSDYGSAE